VIDSSRSLKGPIIIVECKQTQIMILGSLFQGIIENSYPNLPWFNPQRQLFQTVPTILIHSKSFKTIKIIISHQLKIEIRICFSTVRPEKLEEKS
jgi:hypothetical protein